MKNLLPGFLITLFGILIVFSCKKFEKTEIKSEFQQNKVSKETKNAFAEILYYAIKDKRVREFIKKEGLKKFGRDNDVFFPLVKTRQIQNNLTFGEYLDQIAGDRLKYTINNIEKELPLLDILVPDFQSFSINTWDTENQIPAIAIRNEENIKKGVKLTAIMPDGKKVEIDCFKEPDFPLIIVKDIESVVFKPKVSNLKNYTYAADYISAGSNPIFETDYYSYYFADKSLDNNISQLENTQQKPASTSKIESLGCARANDWAYFNSRVQSAFDLNIYQPTCPENTATPRDYVYYSIGPGQNQGPLNYSYREMVTSIRCENVLSRSRFDDIGEGNILDFDIVVYTADNDPIFPLRKRISIPKNSFFMTDAQNPTPKPIDFLTNKYNLQPFEIAVWNFKRQGDTWKYAIFEYDPGTTITESRSISANLGTNFTIGDEKVGGKFGITASYTVTKSVTITITNVSDDLGETVSYWCDPIIKEKFLTYTYAYCGTAADYLRRPPRAGVYTGRNHDLGTGIIAISVEPRQ